TVRGVVDFVEAGNVLDLDFGTGHRTRGRGSGVARRCKQQRRSQACDQNAYANLFQVCLRWFGRFLPPMFFERYDSEGGKVPHRKRTGEKTRNGQAATLLQRFGPELPDNATERTGRGSVEALRHASGEPGFAAG